MCVKRVVIEEKISLFNFYWFVKGKRVFVVVVDGGVFGGCCGGFGCSCVGVGVGVSDGG